jgi:hypothetical protein
MDDVVHSETNGQRPSNAAPDTETRLLTTSIGFPKSRARTEMAQARQAQGIGPTRPQENHRQWDRTV